MKLLLDEEWNMCGMDYKKNKTSSYQTNDIEILSERLESLQITNKTSSETNEQIDEEMSMEIALAMTNDSI